MNSELKNKISIDEVNVSINALELFTRENGLENALYGLLNECVNRLK
jgi:hypothetical protein